MGLSSFNNRQEDAAPAAPAIRQRTRTMPVADMPAPQPADLGDDDWFGLPTAAPRAAAPAPRPPADEPVRVTKPAEPPRPGRTPVRSAFVPPRMWVDKGASKTVVVLDEKPAFVVWEHKAKDPKTGKWGAYETCAFEREICPLCTIAMNEERVDWKDRTVSERYRAIYLTVIDEGGYTKADGTRVPFARRLLPIKTTAKDSKAPFFTAVLREQGTLRGCRIRLVRGAAEFSEIGTPEFVERIPDEDIYRRFGGPERTDAEGKVWKLADEDCWPAAYDLAFRRPDAADLRARYGGEAPAGSRAEIDAMFEEDDRPVMDSAGWGGPAPKAERVTKPASRPSVAAAIDELAALSARPEAKPAPKPAPKAAPMVDDLPWDDAPAPADASGGEDWSDDIPY